MEATTTQPPMLSHSSHEAASELGGIQHESSPMLVSDYIGAICGLARCQQVASVHRSTDSKHNDANMEFVAAINVTSDRIANDNE